MRNTVFIFHGMYGSPEENWFPWMKKELEQRGCTVHIPYFPSSDHLQPEDWEEAFLPYEAQIDPDTILIGHSLGAAFMLKLLERHPVRAACFVAPAFGKTDNEFTPLMRAVADQPFDWQAIRQHCGKSVIFHAENDPYLPLAKAEELARHLHTTVTIVPNAGHFNTASGYTTFPLLRDGVIEMLKQQ